VLKILLIVGLVVVWGMLMVGMNYAQYKQWIDEEVKKIEEEERKNLR